MPPRKPKSFAPIEPEKLHRYNARDVLTTNLVLPELQQTLTELGGMDFYTSFMPDLVWAVRRMVKRGVLIDGALLQTLLHQVYRPYVRQKEMDIKAATWKDFNPSTSSYDIRWYLFGENGIPAKASQVYTDRGLPTLGLGPKQLTSTGLAAVDRDTIYSMLAAAEGMFDVHVRSFLGTWREWHDADKIAGTYLNNVDIGPDGRARYGFKVHGTESGRLSGPLQTWPDPDKLRSRLPPGVTWVPGIDIRDLVVAPPGRGLAAFDYKNIEFVVFAYDAEVARFLEWIDAGVDVHEQNARWIFGSGLRTVEEWQRAFAKTFVFGVILYAGSPKTVPIDASILAAVPDGRKGIAKLRDDYYRENPEIPEYHERIKNEVKEKRFLVNDFGRPRTFLGHPSDIVKEAYNYRVQSQAVHLTNVALVRIEKELSGSVGVCGHHHDALSPVEYPDGSRDILRSVSEIMCDAPVTNSGKKYKIAVKVKTGQRWGSLTETTVEAARR